MKAYANFREGNVIGVLTFHDGKPQLTVIEEAENTETPARMHSIIFSNHGHINMAWWCITGQTIFVDTEHV